MQRLDLLLVERGFASTRTLAQRLIKNGQVSLTYKGTWQTLTKPGTKVEADCEISVEQSEADKYVSRGALKLLGALKHTGLDLTGLTAIDVGQSTGGFTDCLIQHGAKHVVGIEVGHDQLAENLRADPRVTCYEGINARDLPAEQLLSQTQDQQGFDLAVMDVSFISQTKIIPSLAPLLRTGATFISLVKPQFEVGKAGIGRGGIVKDESLYPQVEQLVRECCAEHGFSVTDYFNSPIKGGDGNREFLMVCRKD